MSLEEALMPYVVPTNSLLQAIIKGRHENQDVMSIFTYRYTDPASITDGAAMLDLFWNRWTGAGRMLDDWTNCCTTSLVAVETRLQWIEPTRFAFITKTDAAYPSGQVAGDAYPVNVAAAITKRTQNAGRNQVGTLHMPGVPIISVTNGGINGVGTAKYAALIEEMLKEIVTLGTVAHFSPVLYHKSSPSISPIVVNASLQPFSRVERRRTVGLGS